MIDGYIECSMGDTFGKIAEIPAFIDLLNSAPQRSQISMAKQTWSDQIWNCVTNAASLYKVKPLITELHLRADKRMYKDGDGFFVSNIICGAELSNQRSRYPVMKAYFEAIEHIRRIGTPVGGDRFHKLHFVAANSEEEPRKKSGMQTLTQSYYRQRLQLPKSVGTDRVEPACVGFFNAFLEALPTSCSPIYSKCTYLAIPFSRPPITDLTQPVSKAFEPGGALFLIFDHGQSPKDEADISRLAIHLRHFLSQACMKEAYQIGDAKELEEAARQNAELNRINEIHHRVLNNLRIIQSYASRGSETLMSAIRAVHLLHQMMYEEQSETIDLVAYIHKLVTTTLELHKAPSLDPELLIENTPRMIWQRAQYICIILVELVTNAAKHFPVDGSKKLKVKISLKEVRPALFCLTVADNGNGFNVDSLSEFSGVQIVKDYVNSNLNGHLECKSDKNGTIWKITFTHKAN